MTEGAGFPVAVAMKLTCAEHPLKAFTGKTTGQTIVAGGKRFPI